MKWSRRTLIKTGLGGGLLLALGGVGLSVQSTRLRTPKTPLKALDATGFSILAAVADRIVPNGDAYPSAADIDVAGKIDLLLSTMHPGVTVELQQALKLIENPTVGLLLDGRPSPFTASSPEAQDATLRSWQGSHIPVRRTAYRALQKLCTSVYWSDEKTYALCGYPGPPNLMGGG